MAGTVGMVGELQSSECFPKAEASRPLQQVVTVDLVAPRIYHPESAGMVRLGVLAEMVEMAERLA